MDIYVALSVLRWAAEPEPAPEADCRLNQDGYYDALLAFVGHSIAEKFSKTEARGHLIVVKTVDEVMAALGEIERATGEAR